MNELESLAEALADHNQSGKSGIVARYEEELATHFGAEHAVAVNSGSAAIEAALVAVDARPGTKVLVSAAAPFPTLMPLLASGAEPVFIDCLPSSPAMDPDDAARSINDRVVAALEVPLWGYPLDHGPLQRALTEFGVPIIEDASHAHGARLPDGSHVGTHGLAGCFSTHDVKMLSTGEGGFVLTSSAELAARIKSYSRLADLDGVHDGRNYKPSAFTAAVGRARLPQLDQYVSRRRTVAVEIMDALADLPLTELDVFGQPNGYNLVVVLPDGVDWRSFHTALAAEGISTDPTRYRYRVGYGRPRTVRWAADCPNAEELVWRLVQLPTRGTAPDTVVKAVHHAWERWG